MQQFLILSTIMFCALVQSQNKKSESNTANKNTLIPVDIMVGNHWTMYQVNTTKDFWTNDKLNFFGLVNYEVDHNNKSKNTYFIQTLFSYKINSFLSLGTGGNFKDGNIFVPIIASQLSYNNSNIGLTIQPSIEIDKEGVGDVFVLFEWYLDKNNKWKPFFGLQGSIGIKAKNGNHDVSYANINLGLQKNIFKFGPALNSRFNGTNFNSEWNIGIFFSISI